MESKIIKIKKLKPISEVERVYSGNQGCACGCRGEYYETSRMINKVYNLMNDKIQTNEVYTWTTSKDNFVVYDKSENRTYTLYYKEEN